MPCKNRLLLVLEFLSSYVDLAWLGPAQHAFFWNDNCKDHCNTACVALAKPRKYEVVDINVKILCFACQQLPPDRRSLTGMTVIYDGHGSFRATSIMSNQGGVHICKLANGDLTWEN